MADAVVSFDRDENAAAIARWHAYADQLERYGAPNPAMLAQLRQMLGDTYADFIDAKVFEQQQRAGAYQRVAAQARAHAAKLSNTVVNFDNADGMNRANFDAINVD